MKSLKDYLINEVSRDLVFKAYNKASGVQKKRIKKLYNEIYDKDDDLTDPDNNITKKFNEAKIELQDLVYNFVKKLESTYKKYKKSNPDDVYGIIAQNKVAKEASGYKIFGAEPTPSRPNMLFGVRGKSDIISKIKNEVIKKINLQEEFKKIADKYPDILEYYKPTGESAYWATYCSTIRPTKGKKLLVDKNPNIYFLCVDEISDYINLNNDGYGIYTQGCGDDQNDMWWIFCNDIIRKYIKN